MKGSIQMTRDDFHAALQHKNMVAFLRLIRAGETNQTANAYRTMFGGALFTAPPWKHPPPPGHGRPPHFHRGSAYQFLAKTWDGLVAQFDFEDFSPRNQDLGAVALIAGGVRYEDVIAGRITDAVQKCRKEWASLPGAGYGQPERTGPAGTGDLRELRRGAGIGPRTRAWSGGLRGADGPLQA
jgi:lysozyme